MPEPLYHPNHVAAAIERADGLADDALKVALEAIGARTDGYVVTEAIVRLMRRARIETPCNARRERMLVDAMLSRVSSYASRKYSGLSIDDREDLVQSLLLNIMEKISNTTAIDFLEINFKLCMDRSAADIYQGHIRQKQKTLTIDENEDDKFGDEGASSRKLQEDAILKALTTKILSPEEQKVFPLLFISGVPIFSRRASIDVARLTGMPEGTLREMKTNIKRKLQSHAKEQSQ